MAWTATVTNKQVTDGVVYVTIQFTDGTRTITETYKDTSPTSTWIPNTVRGRIEQLNILFSYDIPLGVVTPSTVPVASDEQLFARRIRALQIVKVMIDVGAISATNAKVVALINWNKNNADEYFGVLDK